MIKKLSVLALLLSMTFESSAAWKVDFNSPEEPRRWVRVNDSVMGGISQSTIQFSDGIAFFTGHLSLENNGGFASVRRVGGLDLVSNKGKLLLTVKGDGRQYQLRLRINAGLDGVAYVARFNSSADWQTFEFGESDFVPQFRGRNVHGAPDLSFIHVEQIGIMISDKRQGNFSLAISEIKQQ